MPGEDIFPDSLERTVEAFAARGRSACAVVQDTLLIATQVEGLSWYFVTTAAETHELVQRAGHPALCTVYDTHHAHIEEDSPAAALAACASTLGHVQVSESHRGVLGSGQVRWKETFRALREVGYDGWLVVESFSRSDPAFGAMLHVWRDLMQGAEDVARPGARFVREHWDTGA